MNRPSNITPLHRGIAPQQFPPLDPQMIARVMKDARAVERFSGPARSYRIDPPVPVWEWVVCAVVAALIGAMLAIGGVL